MAKKFLYFQPEYVNRFRCTGGRCLNNCCERPWRIDVDTATYKKYSQVKPKSKAEEITLHFKYNAEKDTYLLIEHPCPFLTENKLCRLQLEYGEKFLPQTCATYPRVTHKVGKFFERSLTLTCPVAAEKILFAQEPMKFEFVEVSAKVHDNHGKIQISTKMKMSDVAAELMIKVQAAMISILQERTLSIDQRLIVLCFFVDKLEEIYSRGMDEDEQRKLIAAYESKNFLAEQVPMMIQSVSFDAEKFVKLMIDFINSAMEILRVNAGQKFLAAFEKVFGVKPDKNNIVSITEIATNYERLADARKIFLADYSTFLENYLVNELFLNLYPWKHHYRPTRSLSVFLITYKVFELFVFAATQNNLSSKNDLLTLADWYSCQIDHDDCLKEKIFAYLEEQKDFFELMESLFDK